MTDFEYSKLMDAVSALRRGRIIQEEAALRFRHLVDLTREEEERAEKPSGTPRA